MVKLFTEETRLSEALTRLQAYQEAGADGVFIPGLTETDSISAVVKAIRVPLNLLAGTWISDLNALKPLGVSRVTIGSSATRDCAGHLRMLARQ